MLPASVQPGWMGVAHPRTILLGQAAESHAEQATGIYLYSSDRIVLQAPQ